MRRQRSHRGDDRFEARAFHDVLVNRRYVKIEVSPACRACGFHLPEGSCTVAGSRRGVRRPARVTGRRCSGGSPRRPVGREAVAALRHVLPVENGADGSSVDAESVTQLAGRRTRYAARDQRVELVGIHLACPSRFGRAASPARGLSPRELRAGVHRVVTIPGRRIHSVRRSRGAPFTGLAKESSSEWCRSWWPSWQSPSSAARASAVQGNPWLTLALGVLSRARGACPRVGGAVDRAPPVHPGGRGTHRHDVAENGTRDARRLSPSVAPSPSSSIPTTASANPP
jgi:hypothetical protein